MDLDFDLESRREVITRAGGRDGVLFVIETARTQTFGSDVHKKKKQNTAMLDFFFKCTHKSLSMKNCQNMKSQPKNDDK